VRLTCVVLGLSSQAFYKWRARPCSARDLDDAHLVNAIVDVHADDPEFGYRLICDELHAAGHEASERLALVLAACPSSGWFRARRRSLRGRSERDATQRVEAVPETSDGFGATGHQSTEREPERRLNPTSPNPPVIVGEKLGESFRAGRCR
jgi:hypothetical protein